MSATTANAEDPFAILSETLETAATALDVPTAHARESAHRAADTTKRVVGSGVYSVSYALAYGAVFAATYVHDLMPGGSAIQRGFADGAHDALTARSLRTTLKKEAAAAPEAQAGDPGAGTAPTQAAHEAHRASLRDAEGGEARQKVDAMASRFDAEH
ncbi:hypothetical protein [Methylobacterium sp. JK268]